MGRRMRVLPTVVAVFAVLVGGNIVSGALGSPFGADNADPVRTAPLGSQSGAPAEGASGKGKFAQISPLAGSGEGGLTAGPQDFEAFDANHDGSVSRAEWERYFDSHPQKQKIKETVDYFSGGEGFWSALVNSLAMILATELGDKTFFIAAILAMRHDRMAVYTGALGAVGLMTVLSVAIGFALPSLIPRELTNLAAAVLFLYFGGKLLLEARGMKDGVSDELAEVEEELGEEKTEDTSDSGASDGDVETGATAEPAEPNDDPAGKKGIKRRPPTWAIALGLPTPVLRFLAAASSVAWLAVLWQAFSMTFLAEWGDRSQIATIALAAAKEPIGVCIGGVIGHALCTALAVLGGRLVASRISERQVTIAGGVLFLLCGIYSLIFE